MSNIEIVRKRLGPVTAYKYAVQQGYTGTEQEFAALMASYATVAETATQAADDAVDAKTAAEAAQAAAEAAAEQAEGAIEVDDTLSVEGRAADAKVTGDGLRKLTSAINDVISDDYTVLTGTDESGKTINYTGNVVPAVSSYHCVTYVVTAGEQFYINGSTVISGYYYIFTDGTDTLNKSEKNTGSTIASATNLFAIAPEGSTTLIVAYNTSYTNAFVKKVTGHSIDGIKQHDKRISAIEEVVDEAQETADVPVTDITIHADEYMPAEGATISSNLWQYAEYAIPENATTLTVTANAGQNAGLWIIKDISGTVLGHSDYTSSVSKKTESIDLSSYPTATKVFVNDRKSNNLKISFTFNRSIIDGDLVYIDGQDLPSMLGQTSDKLYGKILCCAGDSITYGADMDADGITDESDITVFNCNSSGDFTQTMSGFRKTWGWQIAHRHKMTLYNGGVSGSTMQAITDRAGFSIANGRYTKLPENIDYLVIWFGWNDYAYGTLGAITDTTSESYYGGYNVVLPYLINKYPDCKIALIVPFGASAGHRNAIRQLGNKWGIAVWDNYQGGTPLYFGKEDSVGVDPSIVTANRAKYQANGAHPNYKGHTQLADMIEDFLRGI